MNATINALLYILEELQHHLESQRKEMTRLESLQAHQICQDVKSNGWTRMFDNEAKCPYAYKGDQWVGYEDEESVANKMDFILREKYRGVMVFNNDLDDFRGVCGPKNPLMTVIFNKVGEKALREIRANKIRSASN